MRLLVVTIGVLALILSGCASTTPGGQAAFQAVATISPQIMQDQINAINKLETLPVVKLLQQDINDTNAWVAEQKATAGTLINTSPEMALTASWCPLAVTAVKDTITKNLDMYKAYLQAQLDQLNNPNADTTRVQGPELIFALTKLKYGGTDPGLDISKLKVTLRQQFAAIWTGCVVNLLPREQIREFNQLVGKLGIGVLPGGGALGVLGEQILN